MKVQLKCYVIIFLTITFSLSAFSEQKPIYPDSLKQLNENLITYFKSEVKVNKSDISKLLTTINQNGSWSSIDYTSKQRGNWPVLDHLFNLQSIAIAYQTKGTIFYKKKDVSNKIHLALNYWLANDFQSNNWWYPQIGTPKVLAPILVILESELTVNELKLSKVILERSKIGMTGQNKVWLSANVLIRSLLAKDTENVLMAANSIREELRISMKEGIQPDWSYQQHGAQLQFGNYGLHYIEDMTSWIAIFKNTPFTFDINKMSIMRNYMLSGQQWVIWKNAMDISACGRQLFVNEPVRKKSKLLHYVDKIKKLDPDYRNDYSKMYNYQNTIGNKYFYRTDFHVQRTKDYYFSVKMCSRRVLGAESCNDENMLGYYMGDGVALLYQTEKEYENIFPFWDWKKIPGTTISQDTVALPVLTAWGYHIESDFVGGVSDGKNGMAVMKYNRDNVSANKAWFMFNDMIVCLGSNINSTRGSEIVTSVNQSFLNGKVIIGSKSSEKEASEIETLENPKWILHDNLGYIFPNGGIIDLNSKLVNGTWSKVVGYYSAEQKTANIFKLWFNHGIKPVEQKYAYIVVPNATKAKLLGFEKKQPFNITNQNQLQIVKSNDGRINGIVFYEAATANGFCGVTVNHPCVVMLKKADGKLYIYVSDPTQKLATLRLSLNGEFTAANTNNGKTIVDIELPKGDEAGKTVKIELKYRLNCN